MGPWMILDAMLKIEDDKGISGGFVNIYDSDISKKNTFSHNNNVIQQINVLVH